MTLFDILALGLIGISALVSMVRGVVAEVASLITWVVAFIARRWGRCGLHKRVILGLVLFGVRTDLNR